MPRVTVTETHVPSLYYVFLLLFEICQFSLFET